MFLFKIRRSLQWGGEKTNLRQLRKEDLPVIHKWFADPEIMELAFGFSRTDPNFQGLIESYKREIESNRQAFLAVECKNGPLIGFSSHTFFDGSRRARIGILIGMRQYWNKGYGRDAVMTLLNYLFTEKEVQVIELDTAQFNERAQKCFEACGFKLIDKDWAEPAGRLWYELKREDFFSRIAK